VEAVGIHVEPRVAAGSAVSRRLRLAGKIPSIFYGPKSKPIAITLDAKEFEKKMPRLEGSQLVRFESDVADLHDRVVLIREIQRHPVRGDVLHADFYEVDLTAKIRVTVSLRYTGKPVGVTQGGILQPIKRDLEIECLPADIPERIDVDVTSLGIHGVMHVADLELPPNLVACDESTETVVTVLAPTVEEVKGAEEAVPVEGAEAAPEEAAAAAAAPGDEGKEKKEEG